MSRTATTLNEFEFVQLLQTKCTDPELKRKMMDSFHRHRGNLREVTVDMIDIIQTLYMERTELEFHLDPVGKERSNGKGN